MGTTQAANGEQLATIRARAVNATAYAIARRGITLTHDQVDDLGDEAIDWLMLRLSLHVSIHDDRGVTLVPDAG
jgi:hypothetical protein